jgi:hypothetical protein
MVAGVNAVSPAERLSAFKKIRAASPQNRVWRVLFFGVAYFSRVPVSGVVRSLTEAAGE